MFHLRNTKLRINKIDKFNESSLNLWDKMNKMLSKQANKLIKDMNLYKKGKNFFKVYEELEHDGYDCDGPESNIWTLYIYDINKRVIKVYGREYWYRGEDYEEYSLYKTYTVEDFKAHRNYGQFFVKFVFLQ